jgi:hypothetical protein
MGFMDVLLGGLNKSTNPADYAKGTQYADRNQIMGAITPGLATNRTAPQTDMGSPFRSAQLNQIGQLQGIASGAQKGAGELAAQRQAQVAAAQQMAMARMQRGGMGGALAARNAANNTSAIGISAAGMGQRAAMQDQQMAHGLLTNAAGQGRGQDSQIQLANMDAKLKQMGLDDAARIAYLQQLTGMDANQLQAQLQSMGVALGQQGLLGPLLSAGGQIGAAAVASDERAKTDIADAGDEIDQMLDHMLPKAYVYKDQSKHGVGRRAGVMAQDMAKSKVGRAVVIDDIGDGVMGLDVNKAISAALASSARLNQRVRELERKR